MEPINFNLKVMAQRKKPIAINYGLFIDGGGSGI
jgi:hypothetical protein